ncbi:MULTISPECIES: ImmA/IrrE family metallo-endopeptidase [Lactobacillus]|uniref:ImmA/IrrE family metallo-endopeptidase n=1 Tax=Lactobacillus xujianguonis TaxID=2495899 RepID=A0A437SSJ1_9LACO|nr:MULTISPECIES: ImmA/IrrE family metallo-endopeptidase [Lactobacillus]RVU69837.1 ImmA/IrrE family metallo-endopeptidase [Lactobacillus xujianguonis]RVU77446.1 ImmA/IrrE family metallo-endopeptidase [Lactobacillus xujianguonis]
MSSRLKQLLRKYHLEIKYGPTHGKGYIVKTPKGFPNLLIVKENLSDEETEKVILHEIGHAEHDKEIVGDYRTDARAHDCCESKANNFMISEKVKEYAELGYDTLNANWLDLAKEIGTQDYWLVREELSKYITE